MFEQRGPRLGTEHDQSPCKPDQHLVSQRPDLLEVIFKRRSTSQQVLCPHWPCACAPLVAAMRGLWRWLQHGAGQKGLTRHARRWQATVYVDSVCSKCLQCFFVTDGGTSRPPQQQAPQQAQQAQQASQLTNQPPPGQLPVSSPPVGGQPAHGAPQHGAPHGALLPHRRRCVPMFVAMLVRGLQRRDAQQARAERARQRLLGKLARLDGGPGRALPLADQHASHARADEKMVPCGCCGRHAGRRQWGRCIRVRARRLGAAGRVACTGAFCRPAPAAAAAAAASGTRGRPSRAAGHAHAAPGPSACARASDSASGAASSARAAARGHACPVLGAGCGEASCSNARRHADVDEHGTGWSPAAAPAAPAPVAPAAAACAPPGCGNQALRCHKTVLPSCAAPLLLLAPRRSRGHITRDPPGPPEATLKSRVCVGQ